MDTPPPVPYSRPTTPGSAGFPLQIGLIGLGAMGSLMAKNLANHRSAHIHGSPPVMVWNRTAAQADKLFAELGQDKIQIAKSVEQVVTECDVVITNLANDEVVKSIYQQLAQTLKHTPPARNKIFVEMSTIYPTLAGELDTLVSRSRLRNTLRAAAAQLLILMSGDYRSKKEVAYILVPAVGKKVVDLGGNLEKAPTFKLIGNSMILGSLEILAEAYTLAEKSGIPANEVHLLVKGTAASHSYSFLIIIASARYLPCAKAPISPRSRPRLTLTRVPSIIRYSERMSHDQFDGSSGVAIDGGIKDASHIRRLTAVHNAPMPTIDIAHQHLITARAIHEGKVQAGKETVEVLDWSGIIAGTRVAAGLDAFDSGKNVGVVTED
ncbi:NAD-P-binding protein [Mycena sp. CBHHK59/15]|nr:NAD-P-binding protein [Mycena sp. CBHHK59/15]